MIKIIYFDERKLLVRREIETKITKTKVTKVLSICIIVAYGLLFCHFPTDNGALEVLSKNKYST